MANNKNSIKLQLNNKQFSKRTYYYLYDSIFVVVNIYL